MGLSRSSLFFPNQTPVGFELTKGNNMENQHRYIDGYRDLNKTEINVMNDIKRMGNSLGNFLENLKNNPDLDVDQRLLAIGMTDIQKGLMMAVRSVAKPTSF